MYTAVSAPLAVIAPRFAPLPLVLLTLQLTAELALPAPLTLAAKVTFPPGTTFAELGVMLTVMLPALPLSICTVAEPLVCGADCVAAVIVTVEFAGITCGAVYSPDAEMVPTIEFPPATLFTLQFTLSDVIPVTVAVNCTVRPSDTVVFVGETVTLALCPGIDDPPDENPHPHKLASTATLPSARATLRLTLHRKPQCACRW